MAIHCTLLRIMRISVRLGIGYQLQQHSTLTFSVTNAQNLQHFKKSTPPSSLPLQETAMGLRYIFFYKCFITFYHKIKSYPLPIFVAMGTEFSTVASWFTRIISY